MSPELQDLSMMILIVLMINGLFSFFYRNTKKIDKGFTISYLKLSYRRKMVRTVWMFLAMPLLLLFIKFVGQMTKNEILLIGIFLYILLIIQFFYNVYKMRNDHK